MSDEHPIDAEGLPPVVRRAIARANTEDGSDAQVARLAARVGPVFGLPDPSSLVPSGSAPAAGAKAGLLGGKLALVKAAFAGSIVAGAVAGSAVLGTAEEDAPPPAANDPAMVVVTSTARGDPEPPPTEPPSPPFAETASAAELPRDRRAAAAPAPSAAALSEEARLLKRAGSSIGADPGAALAAIAEHQRRFPSGALTHEREVLAIRALLALGKRGEAEKRLARFARAFPSSPHVARFEEALRGR